MTNITADIGRQVGEASADASAERSGRPPDLVGPTVALAVSLATACFAIVMSLAVLGQHPTVIIGHAGVSVIRVTVGQSQSTKSALYIATFVVILPLALLAATRVANAIARGPNAPSLSSLAGVLTATLAAAIIFVRLSHPLPWGDGLGVVAAAVGAWGAGAAALLARAAQPRPIVRLQAIAAYTPVVWAIAGVLVLGVLLCFTSVRSLSALPLALGAAAVAVALTVHGRPRRRYQLHRWGLGVDALIIVVLVLAIPDVVIFRPSAGPVSPFFEPGTMQFQQDFLLAPANQLLAGSTMLVDTVSQYGVGSIYFVAGWFHLAPIGYGTLGLLDGILTALLYAAAYCVLRITGASRLLAGVALAVGVVALIYNRTFSVGELVEEGPLRFGLPMVLIVATVVGARWERRSRAMGLFAAAVVGVSSVWSLEGFGYTLVVFAAITWFQAWLVPPGRRRRFVGRQTALAATACISAQLIFAGATLAGSGQLPHWGQYLTYVRSFLLGGSAGQVTYDFSRWSPALLVGASYLASAAAIVQLVRLRPDLVRRERTALIALTGTTAYGIALFSYLDNRSSTYLVPYVALPALLAGALWVGLLLRSRENVAPGLYRGGVAFSLSVAVLLVAAAWPAAGDRFRRSALAHAYPDGGLASAVHRLWYPPPIDPRAPDGVRLLARYMPGQRRSIVVFAAAPDLGTEILIRSRRANRLPLADPVDGGYVPSVWRPILSRAIATLRLGDRLLIDRAGQQVLDSLRSSASPNPFATPMPGYWPLDEWVLQQLGERFQVRPIYGDGQGLIVAQLAARQ